MNRDKMLRSARYGKEPVQHRPRVRWCDACLNRLPKHHPTDSRHCDPCARLLDVMAVSCNEP